MNGESDKYMSNRHVCKMKLLMILICAMCVMGARVGVTREHSTFMVNYMQRNDIYLIDTYGGRLEGVDPCTPVNSRSAYLKILSMSLDDVSDYDMEHIVDQSNTPYNQSKNILGNLILAYNEWNRAVGQLNWTMVAHEKRMVYGPIFDEAIGHVVSCGSEVANDAGDEGGEGDIGIGAIVVLVLFAFITCFAIAAIYIAHGRTRIIESENSDPETGESS